MVSFTTLLAACTLVSGVFAFPGNVTRRAGTGNSQGTNNGFYYQFWSNGGGTVTYTNGAAGQYSVQWSNVGDFTAGKGWNPGSTAAISYSAQYNPGSSGGSLAVYGWSTNPLVEYYVMEDFPSPPTSGLTKVGTLTSDGSTYTFYKHQQVNQPSITSSSSTFMQYISIRSSPRTSGTVTIANHFNAWAAAGLTLGTMNYQILSTESYGGGSGSSSVTVSRGASAPAPPSSAPASPTSTAPGTGPTGPSGTCAALYGQCGGTGFTGPTCCASGTCKASNAYYSQCL